MICRFKASLPNSKVFMREYEVKPEITLYEFHEFLLNDLSFSPDQMVIFRGRNAAGKIASEYGLFDMGDGAMDEVTVGDLLKKEENVLEYAFDLFKDRYIILSYLGEGEYMPRNSYPRLVAEKGRNPDQFIRGADDYDAYETALTGQSPVELPDEPSDEPVLDDGDSEDDE